MEAPLNHRQAQSLFLDALDGELASNESQQLETHLSDCTDCRTGFQAYSDAVHRVRALPRHKAPPSLATQVMRRVRRKRPGSPRALWLAHVQHRLPAEGVFVVLMAAAVAVAILLALI